jgi:rhodanese-related sulfurtransferase
MFALLVRVGALVGIGCVLGFALNAVRQDGVRLRGSLATSCEVEPASPGAAVLAPADAMDLCGDPGVLVADVRSGARFAQGHIAGAIHLPCASSGDVVGRALSLLVDKHTLIAYGDTTQEAAPVAEGLRHRLPRPDIRVIVLDGGFPAWDKAGLACSSGPCPECKEHAKR